MKIAQLIRIFFLLLSKTLSDLLFEIKLKIGHKCAPGYPTHPYGSRC